MKNKAKEHLIIALDTSNKHDAIELVDKLKDYTGYFKIGLELFTAAGPEIIKEVKQLGCKIFFDGKFMDIPNTVNKAVSNIVSYGVDMLNVYMSGGTVMIQKAREAVLDTALAYNISPPKLLGVTVLTSMEKEGLESDLKIKAQFEEYISLLTKQALKNNIDGIICSANEAKLVREVVTTENKNDFLIVTPGIRPSWAEANDQRRIATPKEAIENGVTHIVVGRPITGARNPLDAAKKILDEIEEAVRV